MGTPLEALRNAWGRLRDPVTRRRQLKAENARIRALLATSPIFDLAFYLEQNPDVAQAGLDPLAHYLRFGASEGRDPHPLFDSSFYLEENKDVARAGQNPLAHYLSHGAAEGRDPHPLFDASFYLEQDHDASAAAHPLVHYLVRGALEGRNPSLDFDSSYYLGHNPDVVQRQLNPLVHYVSRGYREGRATLAPRSPRPAQSSRSVASPLITVFTPVHNTQPDMLMALAESLLDQLEGDFEWVILDNGSTSPATLSCLRALEGRPGVRLFRSESNLGIVGGSRRCLEAAQGRYVVPVDHDDLVSAGALDTIRSHVARHLFPAFLYSDGDKLDGAFERDDYMKPGFDPVLLLNSCYITHLAVFDRVRALDLGVYDDPQAEGSQDWDTVLRFVVAGHRPIHIPETLYTWRMHPGSTAANIHSKPVVFESQKHVLSRFLAARTVPGKYWVGQSPLFGDSPDWWIRRTHESSPPITTVVLRTTSPESGRAESYRRADIDHQVASLPVEASIEALQDLLTDALRPGRLIHLVWDRCHPDNPEWPWEAMSLFELFPDTAVVGGRVHAGGKIQDAGRLFGFGWGCGCPDRGRDLRDPGYFAQTWKPHSVSAVSSENIVFEAGFLGQALAALSRRPASLPLLGEWASACARRQGRRVVYSPFLSAQADADFESLVTDEERRAFCSVNADLFPERLFFSPRASLRREFPYRPAAEASRQAHLDGIAVKGLHYLDWLALEATARQAAPVQEAALSSRAQPPRFAWLTCVYAGSDASFFRETAQAVRGQSCTDWEWIVLAQGPVSAAVEDTVQELSGHDKVTVLREPENLGIVRGLRLCLEAARADFVVPLDADDLPTTDALAVLAAAIDANGGPPLLYSDEDILDQGRHRDAFFRPDWDPVLNLSTSYVLHLCAFRRSRGLELGVYGDEGVNYCHDWDTVTRFGAAGERVLHVPHVLYHWRAHEASTSNAGRQNPGTLASTSHLLKGVVGRQDDPDLYEVVAHPLIKTHTEWQVMRRPTGIRPWEAILLTRSTEGEHLLRVLGGLHLRTRVVPISEAEPMLERLSDALDQVRSPWLVVTSDACVPRGTSWLWEATKYGELFPDTALVAGRLIDAEGRIVCGGEVLDGQGRLVAPLVGQSADDGGLFNLQFRPQTTAVVPADFFFVETGFLREAVEHAVIPMALGNLGAWLGAWALRQDRRVVFSPLIEADVRPEWMIGYLPDADTLAVWTEILAATVPGPRQGTAGFFNNRRRFHA